MIDNVKPRIRKAVTWRLLPEEIDALARYARRNGTTKSRAVSKALNSLKGYPENLRHYREKYDHQEAKQQAKIDIVTNRIRRDIGEA